jgi:AraC-like DNA-binding protein
MVGVNVAEAGSPNLSMRFRELSSWISGNFSAPWLAEPIGNHHRPAVIRWASADGITISRAEMSPLRLFSPGRERRSTEKYYVYTANQTTSLKLENRPLLRLQPDEMIILGAATPCEYQMARHYVTSSLVIESDIFHQYVLDPERLLGRPLSLAYGLDEVLRHSMESAWEISAAGMLATTGRKLVHTFLELLALASFQTSESERHRHTALSTRCSQVRSYIDRNFSRPDLTVMAIAEHFQLSSRYIQQALSVDGLTPGEYLRNRRLEAAERMLRDPDKAKVSVTKIAFDCGFNSSGYFSTEFRRATGQTPRDFRAAALRSGN